MSLFSAFNVSSSKERRPEMTLSMTDISNAGTEEESSASIDRQDERVRERGPGPGIIGSSLPYNHGIIKSVAMATPKGEALQEQKNCKSEFLEFLQKNNLRLPSLRVTLEMDEPPYSFKLDSKEHSNIKTCESELYKKALEYCMTIHESVQEYMPPPTTQNGKVLLLELLQKRLKITAANLLGFAYSPGAPFYCTVKISHPDYENMSYTSQVAYMRIKEAQSDACMQAYLAIKT